MKNAQKKCALTPQYLSPNQLILDGFETPFEKKLNQNKREQIPEIVRETQLVFKLYL